MLEIRMFSRSISSLPSSTAGKPFDPQLLAQNRGIDLQTAKRTVNVTTQRGVRTVLHHTPSRRFRTNDRQLRYRRLPIDCFKGTLISNMKSRRNNLYAQVFAMSDGWCRAYPMAKKSQAHKGLSLLYQQDGVPSGMVMDGAREQTMGEFQEVGTRVRQTEPHTPWSNTAEAAIRELKKGVGRQIVRSLVVIQRSETAYRCKDVSLKGLLSSRSRDRSTAIEITSFRNYDSTLENVAQIRMRTNGIPMIMMTSANVNVYR